MTYGRMTFSAGKTASIAANCHEVSKLQLSCYPFGTEYDGTWIIIIRAELYNYICPYITVH
jgi:hypothetical protein